ncbi:hypothetical protein ACNPNQ_07300, partial [Serratia odorifera]
RAPYLEEPAYGGFFAFWGLIIPFCCHAIQRGWQVDKDVCYCNSASIFRCLWCGILHTRH